MFDRGIMTSSQISPMVYLRGGTYRVFYCAETYGESDAIIWLVPVNGSGSEIQLIGSQPTGHFGQQIVQVEAGTYRIRTQTASRWAVALNPIQ